MSVSLCSSAVERALMLADTCLKNHRYIEETYHPLSAEELAVRKLEEADEKRKAEEATKIKLANAMDGKFEETGGPEPEPEPEAAGPLRASDLRGKTLDQMKMMLKSGDFDGKELTLLKTTITKKAATENPLALTVAKSTTGDLYKMMESKKKDKIKAEKRKDMKKIKDIIDGMAVIQAEVDLRVIYAGPMNKKGGKDGKKGEQTRFFALIMAGPHYHIEYYDPVKFGKSLGEIAVGHKAQIKVCEKVTGPKVTAPWAWELATHDKQHGPRTFFFGTQDEAQRDNWISNITKCLGLPEPTVEIVQATVQKAMESDDGKAELKALFDSLDKNGDGKVNNKEWGEGAAANKPLLDKHFGGANPATISQAFADGDAVLTWSEFCAKCGVEADEDDEDDGGEWSRKDASGGCFDEEEEEEDGAGAEAPSGEKDDSGENTAAADDGADGPGGDTAEADDEGEWSRKDASGGCFDEDEDGDEDGDEVDFDGEA